MKDAVRDHHTYLNLAIFLITHCKGTVVRLYHAWSRSPDRDDLANKHYTCVSNPGSFWVLKRYACATQHAFHVQMLQVCRQMNYEAAPFFYGKNLFVFEAACHLYAFLRHFENRVPYLRKIGLKSVGPFGTTVQDAKVSWAQKSQHKVLKPLLSVRLKTVLRLLTPAANLEAVYLSTGVLQALSGQADWAGRKFYLLASEWLRSVVSRRKDPLAIIKLPRTKSQRRCKLHWASSEARQEKFLETIARLLAGDEAETMMLAWF